MMPPAKLMLLPEKADLRDVSRVVNENYIQYHLISQQLTDLQNWVTDQLELNKE